MDEVRHFGQLGKRSANISERNRTLKDFDDTLYTMHNQYHGDHLTVSAYPTFRAATRKLMLRQLVRHPDEKRIAHFQRDVYHTDPMVSVKQTCAAGETDHFGRGSWK